MTNERPQPRARGTVTSVDHTASAEFGYIHVKIRTPYRQNAYFDGPVHVDDEVEVRTVRRLVPYEWVLDDDA